MPANCSTLIQRKQNILHKVLRSNSDGKLQNAISETTAELCVGGNRKVSTHSSSASRLPTGATNGLTARRSNLFSNNRVQPSNESMQDKHLPSIRDTSINSDRQQPTNDDALTRTRPKTPARPPSATPSSIVNAFAKRSTENFMSTHGDIEEALGPSPAPPPSRRSHRPGNVNIKHSISIHSTPPKQTLPPAKQSGDSGVDIHFSPSSAENNQLHRSSNFSAKFRSNPNNMIIESPLVPDSAMKERTNIGQLYQRRPNYAVKTPIKQKIDKYRRRSDEVLNANHANNLIHTNHAGLTATAPTLATPPSYRSRPPPASPKAVRRVTSDAEVRTRMEVLRLSMDTGLAGTNENSARHRVKSPYLYTTHQQLGPPPTAQTSAAVIRPSHGRPQNISSAAPSQSYPTQGNAPRRQTSSTTKPLPNTNQTNLYLAFIASRHLSTLEGTLVECDIDHRKLIQIFTWLKNVEEHSHEQQNHDQLLVEQNQRMLEQEDNYSLYSEIEYAVDDIPPNTAGKSFQIPTMNFEK